MDIEINQDFHSYSRSEWPGTVEIDGDSYREETLGAHKHVYRNEGEVALIPSRGISLEDRAVHAAGIKHNEEAQREYGIETATDYSIKGAEIEGELYPVLVGEFRDDLETHGKLEERLENLEVQERVYDEVFLPIKHLAEEGKTTASPLDFINVDRRDSSNIIFDTRNFGYNSETDRFEIIDNGELVPHGYGPVEAPEADLSDYDFLDAEDFGYDRPHDSLEEFLEDQKIGREAERILDELA